MGTERSDEAYKLWKDASEKFDYFMIGLGGALTGYVANNLGTAVLRLNTPTIQLIACLCFVGSVTAGLKRIQTTTTALRLQQKRLYSEEARGAMLTASKGNPIINEATGNVLTPLQVQEQAAQHKALADQIRVQIDTVADRAFAYAKWRDRTLIAGFLLLALSKVLPLYFG